MQADPQRLLLNVRGATTEDLLDRVTAYREGMTPDALEMIEAELRDRGVGPEEIRAHAERCRQEAILLPDGTAAKCSFCARPAVARGWGWHRLFGLLPLFPRRYYCCQDHRR